jgi:two-component system, OmpR family, response regulator
VISFFLNSQGISCHVINKGKDDLHKIKNEKYNVMLLDLAMSEFSGYDLFNDLKKEYLLNRNNILLFAAYVSEDQIQKMVTDDTKGIIRKPISIDLIIESIEKFK